MKRLFRIFELSEKRTARGAHHDARSDHDRIRRHMSATFIASGSANNSDATETHLRVLMETQDDDEQIDIFNSSLSPGFVRSQQRPD